MARVWRLPNPPKGPFAAPVAATAVLPRLHTPAAAAAAAAATVSGWWWWRRQWRQWWRRQQQQQQRRRQQHLSHLSATAASSFALDLLPSSGFGCGKALVPLWPRPRRPAGARALNPGHAGGPTAAGGCLPLVFTVSSPAESDDWTAGNVS